MIITISGRPGSGKSTVGKLLAKKLRYRHVSIGDMRRSMAKERGLTLQQFNVLGERRGFTDRDVDRWQANLGQHKDNLVVEGRTSFYFIPHSLKVFLDVRLPVAARRIFHDPAHSRRFEATRRYQTERQLEHGLRQRIASDTRRYQKYYRLNIFNRRRFNLWIDTSYLSPAQTVTRILAKIRQIKSIVKKRGIKHNSSTPSGKSPSMSGPKNLANIRGKTSSTRYVDKPLNS